MDDLAFFVQITVFEIDMGFTAHNCLGSLQRALQIFWINKVHQLGANQLFRSVAQHALTRVTDKSDVPGLIHNDDKIENKVQ